MLKENLVRIAAVLGALAALVALVTAFGLALAPRAQAKPEDYLAYSLEGLDQVPEDKILYREAEPVKVPAGADDSLAGLCLLPDGGSALSGGSSIFVFDRSRTLVRTFSVGAPAVALCVKPGTTPPALYVAMRDHLEIWSVDGRKLDEWTSLGEKALIASIAASGSAVYAADAGDKNIVQYDTGGRLIRFITLKADGGDSGFLIPGAYFDVAFGDGSLWAVDPGRHRVCKISPDGEILAAWGRTSAELDGFCGCCNPVNIALFPDGSFAVQEKGLLRIKLYDRTGAFQGVVAGPASFHPSVKSLDLAVGSGGTVYAADSHLKEVRIFTRKGAGR
ncbi:MAG: hypothetical protein JXD23_17830 [Spirochaetales bacterium]|nr:hypothetical protein [Spirochaetales bacterium]